MDLDELDLHSLWALFGALSDPGGVPAGEQDPRERERLRKSDAGFYVADLRECVSRRVQLGAPAEGPVVELPDDPDWTDGGPAMWVDTARLRVGS